MDFAVTKSEANGEYSHFSEKPTHLYAPWPATREAAWRDPIRRRCRQKGLYQKALFQKSRFPLIRRPALEGHNQKGPISEGPTIRRVPYPTIRRSEGKPTLTSEAKARVPYIRRSEGKATLTSEGQANPTLTYGVVSYHPVTYPTVGYFTPRLSNVTQRGLSVTYGTVGAEILLGNS